MPSIKDVARVAGVSVSTVSRVLSDADHVRPEVYERVQAAIEQLGYRPNLVARSLRSQQSKTIGLIVSDIRNPFFAELSRAVEDTAYEQGFSLLLCNTDEDPEKEAIYLDLMRDTQVAGVIVSPTRKAAEVSQSWFEQFPTAVVDRAMVQADIDSVRLDNVDAGYRLGLHLIQNGYQRIVALCEETSSTGRERAAGLEKALRASGITPAADMVRYTPHPIDVGQKTVLKVLDLPQPPDAIFTTNSVLASSALRAIRERGLRVPDDIALVSFDETDWSQLIEPGITLVAQPTYEIGKTATELLLQRIAEPSRASRQVILKGQLVVRGSSAPRPEK
jgi:LacI family fructose operon transcriptional repressor